MPNETTAVATANVRENYVIANAIITDVKQERESGRLVIKLNDKVKSVQPRVPKLKQILFQLIDLHSVNNLYPFVTNSKKLITIQPARLCRS